MALSTGKSYLEHFADDPVGQRALLACAVALRLDDESAAQAIEIIAKANGRTRELLHEVKTLGCVWKQWDGSWYLAEEVRKDLADELYRQVPKDQISKLRLQLADKADRRAADMLADGQITSHRHRLALFEAGYQRSLVSEESAKGGEQLGDIWIKSPFAAGEAAARSVDYVAPEMEKRSGQLPVQVLFLRGMAARTRGDRAAQEKYFRAVWEQGNAGQIFAIAAHLFGNLVRDRTTAERAFNDSLDWYAVPPHQGQVWHSLGNLLAKDRNRGCEAEDAYRKSMDLLRNPADQAQVLHSLGNLLAKDENRWREAKKYYRESINLDPLDSGKAQVWHSLGNLLAKDRNRGCEAEDAYRKSLNLDLLDSGKAQVWHSLGNLLAKNDSRWQDAEDAFRKSMDLRRDPADQAQVLHSLGNLLTKNDSRWQDAENAYKTSLELWHTTEQEAQVGASLANLLSKYNSPEADERAEQLALRSLELDRGNHWTNGICYRVLAGVYERRGDYPAAIRSLESLMKTNRCLGKKEFEQRVRRRILRLQQSGS